MEAAGPFMGCGNTGLNLETVFSNSCDGEIEKKNKLKEEGKIMYRKGWLRTVQSIVNFSLSSSHEEIQLGYLSGNQTIFGN